MNDSPVKLEEVNHPLPQPVAEQVLALWEQEEAVIEDKDERLGEIMVLAWADEKLVGIASTAVIVDEGIRKPLFILRALVDSRYRQQGLAYLLYQSVVEIAEQRFDSGEDIRAIGMYVEVEAQHVAGLKEFPCSFSHTHSTQNRSVQFNLVGFTDTGFPRFIYYFENASLFANGPVPPETEDKLAPEAGVTLKFCLNSLTEAEQQQIVGLWLTSGAIETREKALQRLPQVAAVAIENNKIVAVASVFTTPYEAARANLLAFRSFVSPDARGSYTATKLLNLVYQEINKRYKQDDGLKDLHGIVYVLQNDKLNKNVQRARGPDVKSCLAGYLNDLQLRIRYFDGAAVKAET